jgi:hypothetical protein
MGEFNCGRDRDFDLRVCDIELLCVGTRRCAQEAIGGLFFADRLFKDHSSMDSSDLEYHWIRNHSLFVWYGGNTIAETLPDFQAIEETYSRSGLGLGHPRHFHNVAVYF